MKTLNKRKLCKKKIKKSIELNTKVYVYVYFLKTSLLVKYATTIH